MSTLSQLYKKKDVNGTGTTAAKTYAVPVSELYVEPGFNVREINQEHVNEFRDAFIAGEYIPPLAVKVTDKGVKIIDGHHRYYGAVAAIESGCEVIRIECKDFTGSDADVLAYMVTSSQGLALTPIERGQAYQSMINQGWSESEIAKKVKRSPADVSMHLELIRCGDGLLNMVRQGEVSATTAVALSREHGANAVSVAGEKLTIAKAKGKKKITKADAIPLFSASKARRAVELISNAVENEYGELVIPNHFTDELAEIINEYNGVSK